MLAEPEEHRRGKWDVLMLSRELRSKYSGEVESRMPLQTARTGSERGVRATLKRATGPYSTRSRAKCLESILHRIDVFFDERHCHAHSQRA